MLNEQLGVVKILVVDSSYFTEGMVPVVVGLVQALKPVSNGMLALVFVLGNFIGLN